MTSNQFLICGNEVSNYESREAYVSDLFGSSIWGGSQDIGKMQELESVWDAYHRSFKDIASEAGMSCRKLAERFAIPYRTAENWSAGTRECPRYVLLMMQECLGMIKRVG